MSWEVAAVSLVSAGDMTRLSEEVSSWIVWCSHMVWEGWGGTVWACVLISWGRGVWLTWAFVWQVGVLKFSVHFNEEVQRSWEDQRVNRGGREEGKVAVYRLGDQGHIPGTKGSWARRPWRIDWTDVTEFRKQTTQALSQQKMRIQASVWMDPKLPLPSAMRPWYFAYTRGHHLAEKHWAVEIGKMETRRRNGRNCPTLSWWVKVYDHLPSLQEVRRIWFTFQQVKKTCSLHIWM